MRHALERLLRQASARGWRMQPTRGGHIRLEHPTGALVFAASTPSCPRPVRNLAADLRRVERRAMA
jgi:predicted RNA binding protein YcfA (HicA-like mRNA interferase family)